MTAEDDVALKVVHTADWHLGKRFPSFEKEGEKRLMRARMDAVVHILQMANQISADVVLCAGDLFDEPEPGKEWWEALAKNLSIHGKAERPVVLLPGNHDPLCPGSVYSKEHPFRSKLPEWVHVVDRADFTLELEGAVVHAVPCTSQAGQNELTSKLPAREPGDERIRIGLLHGRTKELGGKQANFPIRAVAADELGFDYLALGDTHEFQQVSDVSVPMRHRTKDTAVPVVYPGTPEPTRFGETGAGFAVRVFFPRRPRPPRIHNEQVGHFVWRDETCRSLDDLRGLRVQAGLEKTVLRLTLDLSVTLKEDDELESLLAELQGTEAASGRVAVMSLERKRVDLDTRDIADVVSSLPSVLQATVRKLQEAQQGEDAQAAKRALRQLYGLVKELRAS